MKKCLFGLTAIFLLVSLSFFPLIGGETLRVAKKEVTVEVHTPSGMEVITKDLPVDAIERLSVLQTQGDIDALLGALDELDLLGAFSIGEIKNLINGNYLQLSGLIEKIKAIEDMVTNQENGLLVNVFCYFETFGMTWGFFPYNIPFLLYHLFYEKISSFKKLNFILLYLIFYPSLLIDYIPHATTIGLWEIWPMGRTPDAHIRTIGLLGEQAISKNTNMYGVTIGFTGIIVALPLTYIQRNAIGFTLFTIAI